MMNLEFKTASRERYATRTGKEVSIIATDPQAKKKTYQVTVRMPGMIAETIAERCTYGEAKRIAREQYYAI